MALKEDIKPAYLKYYDPRFRNFLLYLFREIFSAVLTVVVVTLVFALLAGTVFGVDYLIKHPPRGLVWMLGSAVLFVWVVYKYICWPQLPNGARSLLDESRWKED